MSKSERSSPAAVVAVTLARVPERPADRIARLQREASMLAADHAETFVAEMRSMADRALEIAGGGSAYPPGIRDLAARLAGDLAASANSMQAVLLQVGPRG